MKFGTSLLIIALYGSLFITPALCDEPGGAPAAMEAKSTDTTGVERSADEQGGAEARTAEAGEADSGTTENMAGSGPRPKTGTAGIMGYVHEQQRKGNIKIEGSTDSAPPP
jgi:hypothetical protein